MTMLLDDTLTSEELAETVAEQRAIAAKPPVLRIITPGHIRRALRFKPFGMR